MRSMPIVAFVISAFLALALLFFWKTRKTYPGFGLWGAGVSLLSLGYLFWGLRGYIPDSISIFVLNSAAPLAMVFQLAGMRRFLGLTPMSRLWYALPVGVLAAAVALYYGHDSIAWRTLIVSSGVCLPHWAMAFLLLRRPVRLKSSLYVVIGCFLALAGAVIFVRAIGAFLTTPFHLFLDSPVESAFFVSMIVLQIGETLSFLMLNSERVEIELVESEARLRLALDRLQQSLADKERAEESLQVSEPARRQSEEAQRILAAGVEQTAEAIVITNSQGIIEYVNPAFENITGYSRTEVIGQNPRLLKSGEHDTKFYEQLWDTIKEGNIWSGRFVNRRKDGKIYHEEATISPVKDSSGNITNFVAVKRDITEHLDLSKQLLQAQKMEAVGTLAGGVAHDFNNILQVALGYSELILADEGLPQRFKVDVRKINEAARRGADLVKRLLTFSRKTEVRPVPLNLNRRINEVRKMLDRIVPKMIEIQLVLAENLATINADETQVDQILMNLAVNARDAMPEGGRLIIETSNAVLDDENARSHLDAEPGQYVLLTFSDTGTGMDKESLEHIFEPFYTTKEAGTGTGLGLALVYGIVQQHKGRIRCYSEPGQGTTFKIYFPAIVSDEEPEEKTTKAMTCGGSETILLVDDEDMIRDLGSRILTKAGYRVITAANGKEALEVYQERRSEISLVILDLIMHKMGGKKCLETLLKIDPATKVVIASGCADDGPTKEALSEGARGFVSKPYGIGQVLEVIRSVLDEQQ